MTCSQAQASAADAVGRHEPVLLERCLDLLAPEDVTEAVLYLVSDAARYVTGQQLRVEAGALLNSVPPGVPESQEAATQRSGSSLSSRIMLGQSRR